MYLDLDNTFNKVSSFYNLSCKKNILIPTISLGIIFCSISSYFISKLPKPETFSELINYLLSNTENYMITLICSLIAGILCFHNGITLVAQAINLYQDYTIVVYGLIGLVGLFIFIAGFYYASYLISLSIVFILFALGFVAFLHIMLSQ